MQFYCGLVIRGPSQSGSSSDLVVWVRIVVRLQVGGEVDCLEYAEGAAGMWLWRCLKGLQIRDVQ